MRTSEFLKSILSIVQCQLEEKRYKNISSHYNIAGYKRIYLIHIRKTGGTSLNHMFLSLGNPDAQSFYQELTRVRGHRLAINGKVFVGWNVRLINKGNYFYAFSHTPLHKLKIPENTFTITCFRDPVKRVISHYHMLMNYLLNNDPRQTMATEGKWLGNSFDEFIDRIPQEHLMRQLYMFSKDFNVNEAVQSVQSLSHYFFTEKFSQGIEELTRKTGLQMQPIHMRKGQKTTEIAEASIIRLKTKLEKEYLFLEQLGLTIEDRIANSFITERMFPSHNSNYLNNFMKLMKFN